MTMFGVSRLPRSILFGAGQRRAIGSVAAGVGRRALICTDARLGADPVLRDLVDDLVSRGVECLVYDQTQPDPPTESIAECADKSRAFAPDLIIGLGGGSCMDQAKVVAVLHRHGGKVSDYYGEFAVPGPVLPVIAVPTTAGTGSEVTPVAVVADSERGAKIGIASPHLIPVAAVCDPELTLTCPPRLTACSGADALTHAVEAFSTLARAPDPMLTQQHVFVGKNVLSDHFAMLAVKSIWNNLERAYRDGSDSVAREKLMLGALAAGCAFGAAGTAAAHALQYPVGNLTHTAHGDGVATLLPFVMQFNRPACPDAFAELAHAVGLGAPDADEETLSQLFVDGVANLLASVGIPRSLRELGLDPAQRDYVAESALGAARLVKNNPRPLDLAAMRSITYAAFDGDRAALKAL
jgi:alcohol dehydrogenase class IV